MSQTPREETPSPGEGYLDAWDRLAKMIQQGRSFSGRERNCCFLNTRGKRFADVSAVTGLDHIDDGRAVALTDWDQDGDLDLWLANRTGPRVRFLRNDLPGESRFLALRLAGDPGKRTNRDAVGARVEVHLAGAGALARKLALTLHAGDSFLSQSTKWLHFGLGGSGEIERVVVRWPGGEPETFTGLEANRRYRIQQGSGKAEAVDGPTRAVALAPSVPAAPPPGERSRLRLSSPPAVPDLPHGGLDGKAASLAALPPGPVLINLWASWCSPCMAELKMLAGARARLKQAGLSVLALNVEGLDGGAAPDLAAIRSALAGVGFDLGAGTASSPLIAGLEALVNGAIYRRRPFPIPASFLLDTRRRLAVVYRGPVELDQLLADAATLDVSPDESRRLALPFPGRWGTEHFVTNPVAISGIYLEGGYRDDAREYLERYLKEQAAPGGAGSSVDGATLALRLADVHLLLGRISLMEGNGRDAIARYRAALEQRPGFPPAASGLAWVLATDADASIRDGAEAVRLAREACEATRFAEPACLDSLAAGHAEAGDFEGAVSAARKARDLAASRGLGGLAREIDARIELYLRGQPFRR